MCTIGGPAQIQTIIKLLQLYWQRFGYKRIVKMDLSLEKTVDVGVRFIQWTHYSQIQFFGQSDSRPYSKPVLFWRKNNFTVTCKDVFIPQFSEFEARKCFLHSVSSKTALHRQSGRHHNYRVRPYDPRVLIPKREAPKSTADRMATQKPRYDTTIFFVWGYK